MEKSSTNRFGYKPVKRILRPPSVKPVKGTEEVSDNGKIRVPIRLAKSTAPTTGSSTTSRYNMRSNVKRNTTSVTSMNNTPEVPETRDDDESDEMESLRQLFDKIFSSAQDKAAEELLKQRIKAGKFNLRAKVDEQTALIRKLKLFIKESINERKKFQQSAKSLEHSDELNRKEWEQRVKESKTISIQLKQRVDELEREASLWKEKATVSNEAREKMMDDHKSIMEKQQDDLRQRMEVETEKSALHMELTQQKHRVQALELQLETLQQDAERFKSSNEENEKKMETIKEKYQIEFQEKLAEHLKKAQSLQEEAERFKMERSTETGQLENQIKILHQDIAAATLEKQHFEGEQRILLQQLEQSRESIIDLKERLEQKNSEITNALDGLKQVQEFANGANQKLNEEKKILEQKLGEYEPKITEFETFKATQILETQQLQTQLTTLEAAKNQAIELAERLRLEAETAKKELQDTDREASVQRELRSMLESQMRELRNEYVAVNAQMEAVRAESKMSAQRHEQDTNRIQQSHAEQLATFAKEKEDWRKKLESLEEEQVALESEVKTLKDTQNTARTEDLQKLCEATKEVEVLRLRLKEQTIHGTHNIAAKEQLIVELEDKVKMGEAVRRKMHNTIQELRGNVRVYTRTRPFLPSDNETNGISPIECQPDEESLVIKGRDEKPCPFKFDKVFSPTAAQDDVFNEVSEFVQSSIDGYHVCLLSYGQTGSGKTHTMQGTGTNQMRGIIPRSIKKVMEQIELLKDHGWRYELQVSFLEIYNETIRDLLQNANNESTPDPKKHQIKQVSVNSKEVYVTELVMVPIQTQEKVEWLMEKASRQRSVASTDMNEQSSRSHSVFTLHINGYNKEQDITLRGKLNLVDLAGSERLSRSGATGDRMKETQAINKSLSCLADVFAALGNKSSHIPFRNSKLTYLLQTCLSGNGKTLMMVNLSPTIKSYYESLCSLRFAQKVNQCELGKAKRQVSKCSTNDERNPSSGRAKAIMDDDTRLRNRGSSVPPNSKR